MFDHAMRLIADLIPRPGSRLELGRQRAPFERLWVRRISGPTDNNTDLLTVDQDTTFGSAITVAGSMVVSGTTTLNGSVTLGDTAGDSITTLGALNGARRFVSTITTGATAVTAAMSGRVFLCDTTGGDITITLPSAATAGLHYTFKVINAASNLLIDASADTQGFVVSNPSTELGGAAAAWSTLTEADGAPGIKNTANNIGDELSIMSDGTVTW